jgi:hypothetical protein
MDFLALFCSLLVLFVFIIIKIYQDNEEVVSSDNVTVKVHKNGHGHRCYTEGLSYSEYKIVQLLAKNLDHNEYFIFNNIILPSKFTETTQIDHIVVSKYGIFVIESKEYSGWIFANANRRQWTQTLPGGNKFPIYNPLLQNNGHVLAMRNQLNFLGNRFFNVVVFSGDCEFKTDRPENVLYEEELVNYIKSKQEVKLKEVELLVVIGKLSVLCQVTDVTNEEHVQNLRNAFNKLSEDDKNKLVSV